MLLLPFNQHRSTDKLGSNGYIPFPAFSETSQFENNLQESLWETGNIPYSAYNCSQSYVYWFSTEHEQVGD